MLRTSLTALAGAALGLALITAPAIAQAPAAPAPPPPSKDPMAAAAGSYKIDPLHAAVIARIGHGGGFSYSVLRFGVTGGTLAWDPARIEASKLSITVDPKAVSVPVVYGQDLTGTNFFDLAKFPTASFVSTSVKRTGPTTGMIMGDLTLHGVTRPVMIDAQLVGAGKTRQGGTNVGFTGIMKIKRSDFGMTFLVGPIADEVELVLDGEFNKVG